MNSRGMLSTVAPVSSMEPRRVTAGLMAVSLVEQTHPLQHRQLDPTAEIHRITTLAQCRGELDHGDVEPVTVQPVRQRVGPAMLAPEIKTGVLPIPFRNSQADDLNPLCGSGR